MKEEEIKQEAKEVLDKFAEALSKVDEESEEGFVDREDFERIEGEGKICNGFKEKLLKNAPNKDKDFIIAEKGSWK